MTPFEREQRALENFEAWARRGDEWAKQQAKVKAHQLVTQRFPTRVPPPPGLVELSLEETNRWRAELGLLPLARRVA